MVPIAVVITASSTRKQQPTSLARCNKRPPRVKRTSPASSRTLQFVIEGSLRCRRETGVMRVQRNPASRGESEPGPASAVVIVMLPTDGGRPPSRQAEGARQAAAPRADD